MSFGKFSKAVIGIAGVLALLMSASASAQSASSADKWKFSLTPYIWLPNIRGTLKYSVPPGSGSSPEVGIDAKGLLESLDFAMMVTGEARKGRWGAFTDVIYLDLSAGRAAVKGIDFNLGGRPLPISSSIDVGTSSSVKGTMWTLAGSYAAVTDPAATLDVLGGFRYLDVNASTDWRLTAAVSGPGPGLVFPRFGSISQSVDLWDAIVGVKGRARLGTGKWSLPYYVDIGAGSSSLTYQGLVGVAYSFRWGEATLAYRYLYYDQGDDKLIQNFTFAGPALGVTFRF